MDKKNTVILTINCGSSSLKFALFDYSSLALISKGNIQNIGAESSIHIEDAAGHEERAMQAVPDLETAIQLLTGLLEDSYAPYTIHAIGHRIVQGGKEHYLPELITPALLDAFESLIPLAQGHLPAEITAIRAFASAYPAVPQIACFDTAFHKDMPFTAKYFAIPRHLWEDGIIRYGFHGLSYEYIYQQLQQSSPQEARGKIIIAHLGNGASMAAIRDGKSIDTTMGLTPTGGLVMSTRSGDLDPGVILYLLKEKQFLSERALNELLNKQSGLKGVSGTVADIQTLLEKENTDPKAAEAVQLFCYQAKKYIGALTAATEGIDTLIFTGGIGLHAPLIRERICAGLGYLGIQTDAALNNDNRDIISPEGAPVKVRVMATNEELIIAQHTQQCLHTH
ncbi:acetate/propionate family kinase [Chitinophaga pinensis]|uniref:Acetate kinase n=1 Tax=Chitinophaga pinensis (strain ATCC 43595 / DSM 2588 / LMG 13176 / NBRC 15968 / NCIMB 11800 / UQM 2034) TaxID=485918 RepID=A0A979GAT3_CHIPD|nr:acetate/propionate family kinase [Chitinophaga pinensis]ACU63790.1 acetate kinase [Chitinophaga pinensis DSM 2588]